MVMFKAMLNSTETKMHEPFGGGGGQNTHVSKINCLFAYNMFYWSLMFGVRRAECLIGHYLLLASSLALALMP